MPDLFCKKSYLEIIKHSTLYIDLNFYNYVNDILYLNMPDYDLQGIVIYI